MPGKRKKASQGNPLPRKDERRRVMKMHGKVFLPVAGGGGYAREDCVKATSSLDIVHLMTNNQRENREVVR
jgi:hypothetical protein